MNSADAARFGGRIGGNSHTHQKINPNNLVANIIVLMSLLVITVTSLALSTRRIYL
ncbi:MAG: hypothetical protein ACI8RD_008456 [Bacillariaceae sp.]|jgi:hypothetical protein